MLARIAPLGLLANIIFVHRIQLNSFVRLKLGVGVPLPNSREHANAHLFFVKLSWKLVESPGRYGRLNQRLELLLDRHGMLLNLR